MPLCPVVIGNWAKSVTAVSSKMSRANKSIALPLVSVSISCEAEKTGRIVGHEFSGYISQ